MINIILRVSAVVMILTIAAVMFASLGGAIDEWIITNRNVNSVIYFCNAQGYPKASQFDDNHVLCYGDWGSEIFEFEVIE